MEYGGLINGVPGRGSRGLEGSCRTSSFESDLHVCMSHRILDVSNNEIQKIEGLDW